MVERACRNSWSKVTLAAAVLLCPTFVNAQSQSGALGIAANQAASNFRRDRNIGVRNRMRPEYQAAGVNVGGFVLRPKIDTSLSHDDNVYATPAKEGDEVFNVTADGDLESNWSNHMLGFRGRVSATEYLNNDSLNVIDGLASVRGRYDLGLNSDLLANIDFSRNTQPRTASTAPLNSNDPVRFNDLRIAVRATREFNRLRLVGSADVDDFDFDDVSSLAGGVLDQDFRDRTAARFGGRADYAVSPDTAVFIDLSLTDRDYRTAPVGGVERDSKSTQALVGANVQLTPVIRGEVGVGYLSQSYDDPRLSDVNGFGFRGEVEWFPTELTTVSFSSSRSIEESGVIESAGMLSSRVTARVDHELRRNVLLGAQADFSNDDYQNFNRRDRRGAVMLEGKYLINRKAAISIAYNYQKQDSSGTFPGTNFVDNRIGVTLTFAP